jgi:proteasome accessory factor C
MLLPYAIKHPGSTIDELAERLDVKSTDILDDLNLVFMCGLPGYGPGDLIDVDIIEDDRVYVRMADYFAKSLRLTPLEGLVLYAGGSTIAQLPEMQEADALRGALAKLRIALGAEGDVGDLLVMFEGGPIEHIKTLRSALEDGRRVRIEYLSQASGQTTREVDPWGLIVASGRLYLVGHDHLSDEERTFRVDRMKSVEKLGEPAEIPEDFDPEPYSSAFVGREGQPVISFEISPRTSAWFQDYYPVRSAEDLPDGWRRVELYSSGEGWAANLILLLGDQVRNVEPSSVIDATKARAGSIAALYRS